MPFTIEKDGQQIEVYTREEVKSEIDKEVQGLKITNENLKAEKKEEAEKARLAKEALRDAEEAKAKAEGDKETLQRIAEERDAEKDKRISDLISATKKEKVGNALNDLITKLGAGGEKNEDLRDLVKSRFQLDYDLEENTVKVSGDNVKTLQDLERTIKESGRYDAYLAGSGANGGGAAGRNASGAGKKPEDYTEAERVALYRENPAKFNELFNN